MANFKSALVAVAGMALAAGGASAQEIPELKGTWTGDAPVIVAGASRHQPAGSDARAAGNYRLANQTMTYAIEGQDGRRFWGTLSSPKATERLIGSLAIDGKHVYMVDDDGYIDGIVVDANRIDVCYREAYPDRAVVACESIVRKK
jgi:hypothetical protein